MSTLYPDLTSSFPDSVDSFPTWLNIVAADGQLIQQYQSALQDGNTTLANQILAQIPQGTQKIIKASDLNLITSAMLAVERFYKDNIADYVSDKQESWLNTINQFSYKGAWSSGTAYLQNNIVLYTTSGLQLLFLATATPPLGTPPTNTSYWRVLTIQGQQGTSGPGLTYMQEWNASTTYNTNDAVTYSGGLWMALQPNTNVEPGTNEEFWKLVIPIISTTYPIQPNQPLTQVQGDLWFNTQDNPTQYYYLEQLENPADASKLLLNYEAYDDQGNLITGEFDTYTKEEIDTEKAAIIESYPIASGESVTAGQVVDIANSDTLLSNVPVGSIIKINENGVPINYLVVHQGIPSSLYDASCNGTWVLRQDIYKKEQWAANNSNTLPGADIFNMMADMLTLYDSFVQNAIKNIKLPYCVSGTNNTIESGANGLPCQFFPLSAYEVGWSIEDTVYIPIDGAKLSYFDKGGSTTANKKRVANFNGSPDFWWTRSQNINNSLAGVWLVLSNGARSQYSASSNYGLRPAFVLSNDLYVETDGTLTQTPPLSSDNLVITTFGTPSTAIALESGNAGDTIPVIFTGTTSAPFITRDQTIQGADGGVFGYGILDGILGVTAKQVMENQGNVNIETGSYMGTGTVGPSNQNTLTFSFEPKVVFISARDTSSATGYGIGAIVPFINGSNIAYVVVKNTSAPFAVMFATFSGNSLSWYSGDNLPYSQLNYSGVQYCYVALG